jgi:hypothetical protein
MYSKPYAPKREQGPTSGSNEEGKKCTLTSAVEKQVEALKGGDESLRLTAKLAGRLAGQSVNYSVN